MTPELSNPAVALLAWFAAGVLTGILAGFPVIHGNAKHQASKQEGSA